MSLAIIDPAGLLSVEWQLLIERRFMFALSRYDARIVRAEVVIGSDAAGNGSTACQCLVSVELQKASPVSIGERDADLSECIARAAERASRAVGRSIDNAIQGEGNRATGLYTSINR